MMVTYVKWKLKKLLAKKQKLNMLCDIDFRSWTLTLTLAVNAEIHMSCITIQTDNAEDWFLIRISQPYTISVTTAEALRYFQPPQEFRLFLSCNPGEAECIGRAVSGKEMTYFNQNVIEKCAGQCLGSMTGWCFVLSLFWLEFCFMLGSKMSEQILNGFRSVYLTHFTGISLSFQNIHFNW